MKKLLIAAVLSAVPAIASAVDNLGGCGWGQKLFNGQSGIAPNVLAATTNGLFPNTFSMSFGTSGCAQDGAIRSNWKTAMFIDGNKPRLARDMSIGNGETLDALAHLIGVRDADHAKFNRAAQENLSRIFPSENAPTEQVLVALKQVLAEDRDLAQYASSM